MKSELFYTREDGVTDFAILEVRKEGRYYSGYATIGTQQKKIFSGFISATDTHHALVQMLGMYKDRLVLGKRMLNIEIRGKRYKINDKGHIQRTDIPHTMSEQWEFLGVSFHHWRTGIDTPFHPDTDPKEYVGGLVWDRDHGTTRQWGGSCNGGLPRITGAWYCEEEEGQ